MRLMKWEEGWNRSVSSMCRLSSLNPHSTGNSRVPVLNSHFRIKFTQSGKHRSILICLELKQVLTKATDFVSEWLAPALQIGRARFQILSLRLDVLASVRPGRCRTTNPKYATTASCHFLSYSARKRNLAFFGPRTSIGELSSTFYAEFRYVYRIFLSGRVSKIQRTLFVQNSTLRTNETGRNLPLKCTGVWLSPVIGFKYIPLHCHAIACQHTLGPLALVPFFHISKMSWWNLSPCSSLASPRFSGKKSKWDSKRWIFRLILHPIALYVVNRSCTTSWYFAALWFLKKSLQILLKDNHAFLSVSFKSSSNCLSWISSPIMGPINIPSLIFASLNLATYSSNIRIHGRFYSCLSQSFSWGPALCSKGAEKFSPKEQGEDWRHFSPLASVMFI